jgi:hypothetical protein
MGSGDGPGQTRTLDHDRFEPVIDLETTRTLRLALPRTYLAPAHGVIE